MAEMSANEKLVRATWVLVAVCDGSYRGYPRGTVLVQDAISIGHWFDFDSWSASAEYTTARREEIRQVEKEITTIADDLCDIANWRIFLEENTDLKGIVRYVRYQCRCCRILAREQATLAELQRGMKEAPHGKTQRQGMVGAKTL